MKDDPSERFVSQRPFHFRQSMKSRIRQFKSRILYPFRERLVCSEKEAIALIVLLAIVFSGHVIRAVQAMRPSYNEMTYAEMDSLFFLLSARADSAERRQFPVGVDTIHVGFGASFDDVENRNEGVQSWALVDTLEKPKVDFPLDINSADARTLQALPRIGPAMADRILRYRSERGRFDAAEDLLNVRGIGPKTLERLIPLITLAPPADSTGSG